MNNICYKKILLCSFSHCSVQYSLKCYHKLWKKRVSENIREASKTLIQWQSGPVGLHFLLDSVGTFTLKAFDFTLPLWCNTFVEFVIYWYLLILGVTTTWNQELFSIINKVTRTKPPRLNYWKRHKSFFSHVCNLQLL